MKTQTNGMTARVSAAVVRAGLVALVLAGHADRAVAQTQARPTSTVEVGPAAVTDGSFKAGEYNGLQNKGANAIGNVDVTSGHAGFDSDSALRWRVKGTDLGLETRSISADITSQGRFRLQFNYDELRRNRSDTYQTPFAGAGSSVLTLPSGWLVPTIVGSSGNSNSARGLIPAIGTAPYISTSGKTVGALLTPTDAQAALVNATAGADVPAFQNVDLFTKRRKFDVGFSYNFDPKWGVEASFQPEHKEGLKPMGTISLIAGGDISAIVPDRIDANHDQANIAVNYKGARGFAQAGYYGSFFRNNITSMTWPNWASAIGAANVMSSAPSNDFSQVSASGGININPTTRVVVTGSYGRATQNEAFLTDVFTPVVPVASPNALVVTTAFNAKFSARPAKKVNLAAGYKFDNHDNRTPVNIFQYSDAGEALSASKLFPAGPSNPLGAVLAPNANANRPYSRKLNQFTSDADLAIVRGQWIKAGYDFERNDRSCPGSWISCADAATTNEHTARAEWRVGLGESQTVSARLGYAYSRRRTPNYNENAFLAIVPYANVSPATATGGATALSYMAANGWNGWGPASGYAVTTGNADVFFPGNNALANAAYANRNRISELPGMRRYYVSDRNRNKVRGALSWQASDALSLQGGLDLNADTYPDAVYGLQKARGWAVDVDGGYALGDTLTIDLFYTYEHQGNLSAGNGYSANSNAGPPSSGQPGVVGLSGNACDGYTTMQQRNTNAKLDPCVNWSADMLDRANSVGLGVRKRVGRLDITADYVLSRARWDNDVTGGNWANNPLNGAGAPPTTIAALFIPATAMPTVKTDSDEVRLGGRYTIDGRHSFRVTYAYLHMKSNDPAYEGMQFGSLSGVLPSTEQAFNYSVSVFGVSYILTF